MPETFVQLVDENGNPVNSPKDELEQNQRSSMSNFQALDSTGGDVSNYTNKLFGAPFQLLESVDARFSNSNPYLGMEYLRNFILNSPILYIQPGLPQYTGGESGESVIDSVYKDISSGQMDFIKSTFTALSKKTVFNGDNLQKRMFSTRENYYEYMQCVNYMCRSVAVYMGLTGDNSQFPTFTFTSDNHLEDFESIEWQNYRMMRNEHVKSPMELMDAYLNTSLVGSTVMNLGNIIGAAAKDIYEMMPWVENYASQSSELMGEFSKILENSKTSVWSVYNSQPKTVQFMVEPVTFEESLSNVVEDSVIESTIDGITNSIGSEIGFITNSNVDAGITGELAGILGGTMEGASMQLQGLMSGATGDSFMGSLFRGAVNSVKGQKMIYPKIYKSSNSSLDYQFTVTLTTPYGDMYNYYMNIVVPLMHLIALAAPRMVSSNTTTSPFLVRAYIPGMCTCEMGMITQMSIAKNPSGKHVSIQGYPLTVKVTFTITELYNALAISPANDPTSFMFNETLNDYLCNISGQVPSLETQAKVNANMLGQLGNYFENIPNQAVDYVTRGVADWFLGYH